MFTNFVTDIEREDCKTEQNESFLNTVFQVLSFNAGKDFHDFIYFLMLPYRLS